ncbi:MAG: hypothetical protein V7L13_20670 [Nostoc sp.]|uniref:hypothetical protein n=1 Tax=Nostoc sp. TaxID=1180 RepID=UPI002FF6AEAE
MQGDALILLSNALALLPDVLALSTDALALLPDVLALSADALALEFGLKSERKAVSVTADCFSLAF